MGKVNYSAVPRVNPKQPSSGYKYYAQAQSSGDVTTRELGDRIQRSCSATYSDVMAVLTGLETEITDALKRGEIVRLGDLGSFQLSLSTKSGGASSEELLDASFIRKARIVFRPGLALRSAPKDLTFQKVEMKSSTVKDGTAKYASSGGGNTPGE
ncbi:MAG: HU family DNA-binding protein [Bacteroidales bacterium]|nr:HU family DNA-binding protein [Bacteroidales bacterium]